MLANKTILKTVTPCKVGGRLSSLEAVSEAVPDCPRCVTWRDRECLERHAAHQTLMAPFPEHAPSALSASGTLLIVPHDADAAPAPAIVYLSHPSIVFVRFFAVYIEICYTMTKLHIVMADVEVRCNGKGG